MKRIMMTLAAVFCCALAFNACQKPANEQTPEDQTTVSDDPKNNETPSELDDPAAKIAKVEVEYKFQTTEGLLEYFDFTFEYLDPAADKKIVEKISGTDFKKEFKDLKLPLNMGYNFTTTLKEGKTIDDVKAAEKIDYVTPFPSVWITMYDESGKLIGDGGHRASATGAVPQSGAKVAEHFEEGRFSKSYYESVNEKGSGTVGTWK